MSKALISSNAQGSGMKNRIINGGMDIAQRGTSFAAATSYVLDRYQIRNASDAVVTVTQNSDVPSGNEFQNSLRVAVTTADTSITAAQYFGIQQAVEGYNIRDFIGRTFTFSFWVRSTVTGVHCLSLGNSGADRAYIAEYTVNTTNTWEYKTITVSGGLPTAGTWNYTNGAGLYVNWTLAAGSNYQVTPSSWVTTSSITPMGSSNQVNALSSTSNIFAITGVQLEAGAGDEATPLA